MWEEDRCIVDGGYSHIILPDGSAQLQPYHLRPDGTRMVAPCNRVSPSGELRATGRRACLSRVVPNLVPNPVQSCAQNSIGFWFGTRFETRVSLFRVDS